MQCHIVKKHIHHFDSVTKECAAGSYLFLFLRLSQCEKYNRHCVLALVSLRKITDYSSNSFTGLHLEFTVVSLTCPTEQNMEMCQYILSYICKWRLSFCVGKAGAHCMIYNSYLQLLLVRLYEHDLSNKPFQTVGS